MGKDDVSVLSPYCTVFKLCCIDVKNWTDFVWDDIWLWNFWRGRSIFVGDVFDGGCGGGGADDMMRVVVGRNLEMFLVR